MKKAEFNQNIDNLVKSLTQFNQSSTPKECIETINAITLALYTSTKDPLGEKELKKIRKELPTPNQDQWISILKFGSAETIKLFIPDQLDKSLKYFEALKKQSDYLLVAIKHQNTAAALTLLSYSSVHPLYAPTNQRSALQSAVTSGDLSLTTAVLEKSLSPLPVYKQVFKDSSNGKDRKTTKSEIEEFNEASESNLASLLVNGFEEAVTYSNAQLATLIFKTILKNASSESTFQCINLTLKQNNITLFKQYLDLTKSYYTVQKLSEEQLKSHIKDLLNSACIYNCQEAEEYINESKICNINFAETFTYFMNSNEYIGAKYILSHHADSLAPSVLNSDKYTKSHFALQLLVSRQNRFYTLPESLFKSNQVMAIYGSHYLGDKLAQQYIDQNFEEKALELLRKASINSFGHYFDLCFASMQIHNLQSVCKQWSKFAFIVDQSIPTDITSILTLKICGVNNLEDLAMASAMRFNKASDNMVLLNIQCDDSSFVWLLHLNKLHITRENALTMIKN